VDKTATGKKISKIDRIAMDALLYGVSKSLDYLGEQKRQTVLEGMGYQMLEYLIGTGKVRSPRKPKEFAQSLRKLLAKNGYTSKLNIELKGTPPTPSITNFVDYLKPRDPGFRKDEVPFPKEGSSGKSEKVDWILFDMVLYGMTKALGDQLGAQAQLILTQIGGEMLDYLIKRGEIEWSDEPTTLIQHLIDFFVKAGYAGKFEYEIEGSPPDTFVSKYKSARYFTDVFRQLRNEGSALLACPLCLAGQSVLAKTQGIKFGDITEVRILPSGNVYMRAKMYPPTQRFTEEDARKISQMGA
jgi:hypothetical protein